MNNFFNLNSVNKKKIFKSHPAQTTTEAKLSSYSIFLITSMRIAVGACSEYETDGRSSTRQTMQYSTIWYTCSVWGVEFWGLWQQPYLWPPFWSMCTSLPLDTCSPRSLSSPTVKHCSWGLSHAPESWIMSEIRNQVKYSGEK